MGGRRRVDVRLEESSGEVGGEFRRGRRRVDGRKKER